MLRSIVQLLLFFVMMSSTLAAANVGLCVVATGRYIEFVPPLIESARRHFCKEHDVTYFIFTDKEMPPMDDVVWIKHQQLGWPYDSMMRFHTYARHKELLQLQDYLFACDADMRFVDEVGSEILEERVATMSPGFVGKRGSYETKPQSLACVLDTEGSYYFAGGFYGGESDEFLQICVINAANIDSDLKQGIIAVWHDESHLNRYFIDNPPTKILTPEYCYPESWNLPYRKRLLALDKIHSEYRKKEEKPILIVIPSRNNEEWLKRNLTHLLRQKYTNYRVIYLDDASTDDTRKGVMKFLGKQKIDYRAVYFDDTQAKTHEAAISLFKTLVNAQSHKLTLVTNINRCGGLCNIARASHSAKDDEIVATLDGDDWFYHDRVLAELNDIYCSGQVWYTHGSLIEYPSLNVSWCDPIAKEAIATNNYRKHKCPSHLRTYYAWLFKRIKIEDMLHKGQFYPMAWDMAMMFPMAEMAAERHAFIKEPNYVYNMATDYNDNKVNPELQNLLDKEIRNKPPYQRLQKRP